MDSEIEVEDISEHAMPDSIAPGGTEDGLFFPKLLMAFGLLVTYLVLSRFGGMLATWLAKRGTGTFCLDVKFKRICTRGRTRFLYNLEDRNYDMEMREARRRLQERFDSEMRNRQEQVLLCDITVLSLVLSYLLSFI